MPVSSALNALYLHSDSRNCLLKYPMALVIPSWTCVSIGPSPPLIGGVWCSCPTEASTWSWNGKLKFGKAMAGRDDIILISFFHACRASCGSGPLSFSPLQ